MEEDDYAESGAARQRGSPLPTVALALAWGLIALLLITAVLFLAAIVFHGNMMG